MSRRLLLIDDEEAIREIARISLERVGDWSVEVAASGWEAVEIAGRGGELDAVVLDFMMPGLDGPSTMRSLRGGVIDPGVPFVFLTAKLQPADRRRLAEIGAAGVIAKPFDPMALADELDRILVSTARERVHAAFAEQWMRALPTIEQRVAAIDAAVAAISEGSEEPALTSVAIAEAHKLAGVLGTFGLSRGSELARQLESALEAAGKPGFLDELSAELRQLIKAAEVESRTRT